MEKKYGASVYPFVKWAVKTVSPKMEAVGLENIPDEPVIFVANHCQMYGPIACELYAPGKHYIWCAGEMMDRKTVPEYAFQDFWSQKPQWTQGWFRLLSHIIAPLSECVFTNADTIGVYHDTRILSTFKQTVAKLLEGAHVVIFPEHDVRRNHIIYDFQNRFIDIARLYYKRTGKALCFVPMYIAPRLGKMYLGEPVRFSPEAELSQERARICDTLMERITALGCTAPEHTVVPYRNIPKRDYPSNKQEVSHEKECG